MYCTTRFHPKRPKTSKTHPKRKRRVSCVTVSFSMSGQALNAIGSRNNGGSAPFSSSFSLPFSSPTAAGSGGGACPAPACVPH